MATQRDTKHAERVAELEGERNARVRELEDMRSELEDAKRAAIAVKYEPLPFVPRFDQTATYRHPKD